MGDSCNRKAGADPLVLNLPRWTCGTSRVELCWASNLYNGSQGSRRIGRVLQSLKSQMQNSRNSVHMVASQNSPTLVLTSSDGRDKKLRLCIRKQASAVAIKIKLRAQKSEESCGFCGFAKHACSREVSRSRCLAKRKNRLIPLLLLTVLSPTQPG